MTDTNRYQRKLLNTLKGIGTTGQTFKANESEPLRPLKSLLTKLKLSKS